MKNKKGAKQKPRTEDNIEMARLVPVHQHHNC